jgi:hypothetical protein
VKLKIAVLDLYIAKRKLKHSKAALKREKVDIVGADIVRSLYADSRDDAASDDDINECDDSDNDEEDIVKQKIGSDDDIEDDEDEEDNEDPNCEGQTLKKRIFPIFCRPQDRGEFVELGWEEHEFLHLI